MIREACEKDLDELLHLYLCLHEKDMRRSVLILQGRLRAKTTVIR